MHSSSGRQISEVVGIEATVFVGCGEIESLHRVPGHRVAARLHDNLPDWRGLPQIVQRDRPVAAGRRQDVGFHLRAKKGGKR